MKNILIMCEKQKEKVFFWTVVVGIGLRFFTMSLGCNFDFESYCIVGELASSLKNVYENTYRYNYGPLFLIIQGIFYFVASHVSVDYISTYRVFIVFFLMLGDLGISVFLKKKYSFWSAVFFFLNPISIIISGFHNQFDNIAVLLMLVASLYFNEEEKFGKKDALFILFMSLSLIMKHIFFLFPFWLLIRKGNQKLFKRFAYACLPPFFFLLSFIPFIWNNPTAREMIKYTVFFYKSNNNAPLLKGVYDLLGISEERYFIVFVVLLCITIFIFREKEIYEAIFIYTVALVTFSSAVTSQYLAIPVAAICVYKNKLKWAYLLIVAFYFMYWEGELGWNWIPIKIDYPLGPVIAVWILFLILCKEIYPIAQNKIRVIKNLIKNK